MKTINYNLKTLLIAAIAVFTISSCTKDNEYKALPPVTTGFYILNEGGFMSNNASLSYYNLDNGSVVNGFFAQKNGRGLGDTGNDIQIYGSKMYIVVNASNTVEVVDAKSVKSIKRLDFKNEGVGRQPRYVVFNKNKAFVSSFDGTVAVIDTASLAIEQYIKVGRNPDGMAIANNKLYVANSGGLGYQDGSGYEKTVSVIDLTTLKEIKKIEVGLNPVGVTATPNGKIYIKAIGDYDLIKASMTIIDSKTDLVTSKKEFAGSGMTIVGDKAYFLLADGIMEYDWKTDAVVKENVITDGTKVKIPYGLTYDVTNEQFFVCDAVSYSTTGEVLCLDKKGKLLYKVAAGIMPNKVVFLNK